MTNSSAASNPSSGEKSTGGNRLSGEKSPYLLQHADNPVDWYPWGAEAFEEAKKEDKPIFLSIGYATCHWCHVMEHESFENPDVAKLMNETFVNIKVDREERPDIDQVYMSVCQMLTGGGGWPLTIIMTPEKQPFYAGTYFPVESRYGRIGMIDLIPKIRQLWETDRDKAIEASQQILANLQKADTKPTAGTLTPKTIEEAYAQLANRYDDKNGGFGTAPKFPSPHNLVFLTRYGNDAGNPSAIKMVEHTLQQMRYGGIYDQLGFGFHRYSTDPEWLVPHFEKMLYDQAMLTLAYTEAWLATGNSEFERTVREIVGYVLRDMTAREGGFYSAEDADSEGEEGLFYLWSSAEVKDLLTASEFEFVSKVWNLTPDGNYADEASGERTGLNIPHLSSSNEDAAARLGEKSESFRTQLDSIREDLFSHREKRIHPLKDDKVLADWNGLMAAALARAGRVFGEQDWIEAAKKSSEFVFDQMRTREGRLLHRYRDGEASVPAFLDDYVFQTTAMLEIYDATLDAEYLTKALKLQSETINLFWDQSQGGFFYTAEDNEQLLVRQKEVYDGAIPSGNSMAAENLLRLSRLTGDNELTVFATKVLNAFAFDAGRLPSAHTQLIMALQLASQPSLEVVIVGDPKNDETKKLVSAVRQNYLPHIAVLLVPSGEEGDQVRKIAPFAKGYVPIEGRPAAYVCRDFQCQLPTTDPKKLSEMLEKATKKSPDIG